MLQVNIDKIMPVTDARDSLNKIVDEVSGGDELYVLTVNGKPSAIVVGVHHLEKLTGMPAGDIMASAANAEPITGVTPTSIPTPAPTSAPTPSPVPAAPSIPEPTANADDLFENTTPANTTAATETPAPSLPQSNTPDTTATVSESPVPTQPDAASGQFVTPNTDDLTNSTDSTNQTPTIN